MDSDIGRLSVGSVGAAAAVTVFKVEDEVGGKVARFAVSGSSASRVMPTGGDLDTGDLIGEPLVRSESAEKREIAFGLPKLSRLSVLLLETRCGRGGA